jgi:hypothetical protein
MIRYTLTLQRINILLGAFFVISSSLFSQVTVNSITELRGVNPGTNQTAQVRGYYEPDDGGGGLFRWDATNTAEDNYGTIIRSSVVSNGRWKRDYSGFDHINVLWFGAKGDNIPDATNHLRIQAALDYAASTVKKVFLPIGIYQISNSIRLTELHNNLLFFGKINYTHDRISRSASHNITWSPHEYFRVVDENNSSVIKAADYGFKENAYVVRVDHSGGDMISGIHLRDFAINGNLENNPNGGTTLFLYGRKNSIGMFIENLATYNSPAGGIMSYQSNVNITNFLAYSCYFQGLGTRGDASGYYKNVEIHNTGFGGPPYGYSGINFQQDGIKHTLVNAHVHHCWSGQKITAPEVSIFNSVYEYNFEKGINIFAAGDNGVFHFDKIVVRHNGNVGAHLNYGDITIGKIESYDNGIDDTYGAWGGLILAGVVADTVIVKDQKSNSHGNYSLRVGGADIKYVEIANNSKLGIDLLSGSTLTLRSGKILNNRDFGVQLGDNSTLYAYNLLVGDNQETPSQNKYEFWDPWNTARIEYSNIDFSNSVISPNNRIRVNSISEVSNTTIVSPSGNKLYVIEDGLLFQALASSPHAAVRAVQFFANDLMIGEVNEEPYELTFFNLAEGKYTLKAIALFTDNSRAESNTVMITVKSRRTTQIFLLHQGWNTISTYLEPDVSDVNSLLSGIIDNLSMVSSNTGNVYWPSLDIDEINQWDYHEGYQLYMDNSDTLIISGSKIDPSANPIELSAGWNLTGYLPDQPFPIEKALETIGHTVQIVTNNSGEIYWPETGINSIGDMTPGQGYKIFVGSDTKLIYPSLNSENQNFVTDDNILSRNKTNADNKKHYVINKVSTGIASVLLVEIEGLFFGNEIGVWTESGKLVGSGHVINGKAALTVWGRNEFLPDNDFGANMQESLWLTLWSAGMEKEYPLKIIALHTIDGQIRDQQNLFFEPDAILIAKVEIEETIPQSYTLEQNFPNPFNPTTTIRYEIPRDAKVTIDVYNLLGQKIRTLVDEEHSAGVYQIVFTGEMLASGVYFYRIQAGNYTEIKKMVLLR